MRVLERLRRQVELIEEYVRELEYERSYRGIERLVQLVVQALLDLGTMVIAALNGPRPRSYSEIGAILRSLGVLGDEEADLVRSLAGLGNVLLHGYAVVDRGRVVEFASRLRGDATRLASAILRGTEGRPVDPGGPGPSGLEYIVGRARGVLTKGGLRRSRTTARALRPLRGRQARGRPSGGPGRWGGRGGCCVPRRATAGARSGGPQRGTRSGGAQPSL